MKALFAMSACLMLPFASHAADHEWTIGNGEIERTLLFGSSGLFTQRLSDVKTHTDFIQPNNIPKVISPEFSFQCEGRGYSGYSSEFALLGVDDVTRADVKSLTVRLRAQHAPLDVTVVYRVYAGQPAIRKNLLITNTGSLPLRISHLDVEAIGPSVGPANETILNAQYGALPREIFYTGRSEDAALLVSNGRTGVGFAIVSEVPGYMKRTEINGWHDTQHVGVRAMYDTDLMPFARTLAPGEEFKTAAVSFIAYKKGDGFRDPKWVIPSYMATALVRRLNAHGAPWIYNTWEPFERNVSQDLILKLVDIAANIGMDIFTIDDGWQQTYGENTVNMTSFPSGLKPIQDAIEAKGMRLGLWIPVAAIGPSSADFQHHPEWGALDQNGKQKTTGTMAGQAPVMCLATPFRDSAADRINQAIEQFHLAYVKLDLTTIFNAYGEAPGCWAKGHDHKDWAESLNRIYEGIDAITAKVYAKHPDVLLDLTFELWGQKHIIDAGLLAAGDLDWMSNVDDNHPGSAGPLQARTLLYQRATSMPVESMLIGNIHAELPTIQESFATEIGSAPVLLGDLRKLAASDQQWYHDKILWFKRLRATTRINESFFPLGSWLQPSPAKWDGFARLDHSGHGLIALFRNEASAPTAFIELPLMPKGSFKVRSVMNGKDLGVFSQDDWKHGVQIDFPVADAVQVVEISPTS
jgi:alpha-galactosidase